MERYVKCDPHVHTGGVSLCCPEPYSSIIDKKVAQGYQMAVLTNHSQSWYCPPEKHYELMQRHIEEFHNAHVYAKARGLTLLLGIEVTLQNPFWADWLLYGVTEKFLLDAPCLYAMAQDDLFELCKRHNVVMVQAHPLRHNTVIAPDKYAHGIEINCSAGDLRHKARILEIAKERDLLVTCGTDFHGENPFIGGTYVPDWVQSGEDFGAYLRTAKETKLFFGGEDIVAPAPRELIKK